MSSYPYTWLFVGKKTSVAVSGPHMQILDTQTGNTIHSTHTLEESKKSAVVKSGPIRCIDVDAEHLHIAASGEDKKLKVWRLDGLELLSERELPKKPTGIHFTRDGQNILVSDKFGDIFSYPLHPIRSEKKSSPAFEAANISKRSAILSHENPSDGTLILGHTSLLTTFVLTEDDKYVISADRDEHIRVSWHPQGYVIERFCLGHRKFVSAIHVPQFTSSALISGGGDPELKLWDWMSGEHLGDIPILQAVEPCIAVWPPKGRANQWDEDGEEAGADAESAGKRKGKGKKGKGSARGKGKGKVENEDPTLTVVRPEDIKTTEDALMGEESSNATPLEPVQGSSTSNVNPEELQESSPVLVVSRILSVNLLEHGRFVMFSAVGATAIFYFEFPSDLKTRQPAIHAFNLHHPVINFSFDESGDVWVLVDCERQGPSAIREEAEKRTVRLLRWVDGKLGEVNVDSTPSLVAALNDSARIPATSAELKTLDLYLELSSMPKNVDPEHDPMRRNDLDALEAATNPFDSANPDGTPQIGEGANARELTQREAARLKRKLALEAKIQQDQGIASASPSVEPENRLPKKAKSETGSSTEQGDIEMQNIA